MIHNYSDYIKLNEGSKTSASQIYWNKQLTGLVNEDWSEISTTRYNSDIYEINFKSGNGQYNYYSVLVEPQGKGKDDIYYLEDNLNKYTERIFQEKLKTEFWKTPQDYYKQLKYTPKCLGDISHLLHKDKYEL